MQMDLYPKCCARDARWPAPPPSLPDILLDALGHVRGPHGPVVERLPGRRGGRGAHDANRSGRTVRRASEALATTMQISERHSRTRGLYRRRNGHQRGQDTPSNAGVALASSTSGHPGANAAFIGIGVVSFIMSAMVTVIRLTKERILHRGARDRRRVS